MYQDFISAMYPVFSTAPKPERQEITPHRCCECDAIRDNLFAYEQRQLPNKLLLYHGDSLPLLSPTALRYYLPRYMEFSLLHQDSNACEFILYHLAPDDIDDYWQPRINIFTKPEKQIIVNYLQIRETFEEAEFDAQWISRGFEIWQ